MSKHSRQVVLVVDDDPDVRELAEDVLDELGYCVIAADSGEAALELFEHLRIDLLFTDIVMPGMTGIELADAVHSLSPETRILCTTGFSAVLHGGAVSACEVVLRKPYLPRQLEREVGRLLPGSGTLA